jgi:hypothetical protein
MRRTIWAAAACAWMLAGCALEVQRVPVQFSPSTDALERTFVISQDVVVVPSAGYARVLKAGSTWKYVGRVPQGSVYAIKDDVFMLEGRHHHEAQCVVSDDQSLVGFYLPVEKAFASIQQPVQLRLKRP